MSKAKRPIITLTTDFGWQDPYVGIMKGVILSIAPEATIVDLTHDIYAHDILQAALVLKSSYKYFPEGSIHVVVVDPGVGGARRPLLATTDRHSFVGPDNGVLSPVLVGESNCRLFHLTKRRYFLDPISSTFHGRDIFAPVAAWLFRGVAATEFGEGISSIVELRLPEVRKIAEKKWVGTVLRVDKFGNLITNVSETEFAGDISRDTAFLISLGNQVISRLQESYSEAPSAELFAIWGSAGYLEISSNQASAAEILEADKNQQFTIEVFSTPARGASGSGRREDRLPGS
jgi:S-adenosylmethionine hydrolase